MNDVKAFAQESETARVKMLRDHLDESKNVLKKMASNLSGFV